MRYLLVVYRFLFFSIYTARIVAEVYWRRVVLRSDMHRVMAVRRRWAVRVLDGVGVKVQVEGTAPDFPCLLLANHRSYLDPILILRHVDAYPVAKAELAQWPLLGKGAAWAGILYVQRQRGESRISTLKAITDTIQVRQFSVILFPEGTTSDLPGMLPFNKGAIRAAAKRGIPVVPVAIRYSDSKHFWVGDVSFLQHAWRCFQQKQVPVTLCYGPASRQENSEFMEQEVREWIEEQLLRPGTSHEIQT